MDTDRSMDEIVIDEEENGENSDAKKESYPKRGKRIRERKHVCEFCPSQKAFGTKYELREHLNSHTGHRPHKCEKCGKWFVQKASLWNHKRTHSNERPFACELCDSSFKWKRSLVSHMKHHQRVLEKANQQMIETNWQLDESSDASSTNMILLIFQ